MIFGGFYKNFSLAAPKSYSISLEFIRSWTFICCCCTCLSSAKVCSIRSSKLAGCVILSPIHNACSVARAIGLRQRLSSANFWHKAGWCCCLKVWYRNRLLTLTCRFLAIVSASWSSSGVRRISILLIRLDLDMASLLAIRCWGNELYPSTAIG